MRRWSLFVLFAVGFLFWGCRGTLIDDFEGRRNSCVESQKTAKRCHHDCLRWMSHRGHLPVGACFHCNVRWDGAEKGCTACCEKMFECAASKKNRDIFRLCFQ